MVLAQGAIEPEDVAEAVVQGLRAESFLILPHPEVLTYFQRKAGDYDRWLGGHAQAAGADHGRAGVTPPKPTTPAALTESALLEVGLRPGDRVRFRRAEGGAWKEARVERRERDGSVGRARRPRRRARDPGRSAPGAHHRPTGRDGVGGCGGASGARPSSSGSGERGADLRSRAACAGTRG